MLHPAVETYNRVPTPAGFCRRTTAQNQERHVTARRLRIALVILFSGGHLLSASCGDIVIDSVKSGLFQWVSGSVSSTFGTDQLSAFFINTLGGTTNNNNTGLGT